MNRNQSDKTKHNHVKSLRKQFELALKIRGIGKLVKKNPRVIPRGGVSETFLISNNRKPVGSTGRKHAFPLLLSYAWIQKKKKKKESYRYSKVCKWSECEGVAGHRGRVQLILNYSLRVYCWRRMG